MTIKGPLVRDYTDTGRSLGVDVVASPAAELLASLFVLGSEDDPTLDGALAERREAWRRRIEAAASPGLLEMVARGECCGYIWLAFMGDALEAPEVDAFIARAETTDPVDLRRRVLMLALGTCDAADLDRIAAGDLARLDEIVAEWDHPLHPEIRRLMGLEAGAIRDELVSILRRYDESVFRGGDDVVAVLERDAADKRAMAVTMEPAALVEAATGGVTFALQPEVRGVVLIPSIALSPWVTITEHEGLHLFVYPVADHHLDADPDTPPQRLVEVYKALGDERRLKILRMLGSGPASLKELTERLDLAKSTVHHHLRVLRTAGLVRVTIGDDKEYSLRVDAVPEAASMLSSFLD